MWKIETTRGFMVGNRIIKNDLAHALDDCGFYKVDGTRRMNARSSFAITVDKLV